MIEVGTRKAKAAVGVAGSDQRGLELERSRSRAGIPQVVRGLEGEGTAVVARVRQPGPQLAAWTDVEGSAPNVRGLAFRKPRSKVAGRGAEENSHCWLWSTAKPRSCLPAGRLQPAWTRITALTESGAFVCGEDGPPPLEADRCACTQRHTHRHARASMHEQTPRWT